MIRSRRSTGLMLALTVIGSLTLVAPARAQNAFCDLLTPEEVGQALGGSVAATSDLEGCTWSTADTSTFIFLSAYWDNIPFDERKAAFTGTAVTVGGREAWYATDVGALYVPLDQGVLVLQAVAAGEGIDLQTALPSLGQLVVERGGGLPTPAPEPTPMPMPSFEAVAELEALFPQTVGGEPMIVQSMTGEAIFALASDDEESAATRQRIEDALAAQGRSLADLSFGFGGNASGSVQAVRIAGGDAAALTDLLITALNAGEAVEQTPGQVAGKDVIVATAGGSTQYVYPKDDILWVVIAAEPGLTEIFEALP